MDQELLKQRKEKYRQWFHNHKKHKANAKAPMKLHKKWTACRVIKEQRKANILQQIHEEIEEETGQKPAQKEVLRRYQPTMTAIMKGLDDNELEEAWAKADEWTNRAPDPTVQVKMAKKKGEKMIKHFTKEMFTQAGMRLFVLGSWKDEKGGLLTSGQVHLVNRLVILPAREDYISDEFNQDQDQEGTLLGGTCQVPKPYHEFNLDHMGICCGKWKDNQVGVTLKFKAWIDDKGKMHPPVGEESHHSDSDADDEGMWPRPTKKSSAAAAPSLARVPKGRPRFINRAHVSSTDEESDVTDADVSQPKVSTHAPGHLWKGTNADHSDQSLGKRARIEPAIHTPSTESAHNDQPMARHQPTCGHHPGPQARGFGPHSTHQGLEHLSISTARQDQEQKKTRVAREALLVVNDWLAKKTKAVGDVLLAVNAWLPKKAKAAKLAAQSLSDTPAKSTRSQADNGLGARIRQKPKKYADYV
ncbi:hypothetical protein BDR06DRAFT_969386 [Suillus hirtellus]|nr:hypothetical protein BDR06DRAFT_969386 [Suillus hirtellus]